MADLLPDAPPPSGGRWPRDWHDYANYQVVHDSQMTALYNEGVVVRDTLEFIEGRARTGVLLEVNLRGRVHTAAGAILTVNKWLVVEPREGAPRVRTREYDYHAHVLHPRPGRDLFRYDNAHGDIDTLHRHRFDLDGTDRGTQPVDPDTMPPLSWIIREADWLAGFLRDHPG